MHTNVDENRNEEWKKLFEKLVTIMAGNDLEKESNYRKVWYCYQCYAPASLFKYYCDTDLNFDTVRRNEMWYSAPCASI